MTTIQCPICYSDYKDPENFPRYSFNFISSVLICGHTICSTCIIKTINLNAIKCPICSFITSFPFDVDESQRVNYLVGNFALLEALNVDFDENNFNMPDNQMCIKMPQVPKYEI